MTDLIIFLSTVHAPYLQSYCTPLYRLSFNSCTFSGANKKFIAVWTIPNIDDDAMEIDEIWDSGTWTPSFMESTEQTNAVY